MPTLSSVEEILRNRVKIIDEGEWTLLGTPDDVIKELEALINQQIKSVLDELEGEVIGGDESSGIFPEIGESSTIRDSLRAEQRKAIQKIRSRYE